MDGTVVVAGGGLAGLVAARHLAADGVDVRVFERRETVGGRVRSRTRDGFTLDRGFQVLFTAYPSVRRELDLDALDLRYFKPGSVLARPGNRSVLADPFRDPRAALAAATNREVTVADKLRTLRLRRQLRRRDRDAIFDDPDASIREFLVDCGFSTAFVEHFAAPFYGGITLDRSLETSKRVFELTFKALSEGSIAVPAGGMGAVTRQLADRADAAGAVVETGRTVESIEADDAGATVVVDGEVVDATAAIVATDPRAARTLTDCEAIPTDARSCVTQYYSLPKATAPDGKRLFLNLHSADPNHVVPHSSVAPEYGDGDRALLSATFLGTPDADDVELATRTRRALESWYPERRFETLDVLATDRIEFAQFSQPPGVHDGLPAVDDPNGRCYLAGEYTAWSSIDGAMQSGRTAARHVLAATR